MKIVNAKFLFFLIGYASSNFISDATSSLMGNIFQNSTDCIFGVESISVFLYTSEIPYGKDIGVQEVCDNDTSKRIVFFVHGFTSSANNSNNYKLIRQLSKKNYKVYSLDWSAAACKNGIPLVKLLEYPSAVNNTREVGKLMAKYVIELIKKCGVSEKNIIFVGHSLGAHVSGFAAKTIKKEQKVIIPLIIGADPASPEFAHKTCSERLCKSDAKKVLVFHTSILGILYPIGHCDFYFDNSTIQMNQPGCALLDVSCSHGRSISYQTDMLEWDCGFRCKPKHSSSNRTSSETTDCIFLNDAIYERDYIENGSYSVFVEENYPYCTNNTFNCQK